MSAKQQPEALRLADALLDPMSDFPGPSLVEKNAAAELRRLHLANARQLRLLQRRDAQINDLKKARDYRFKQQVKAEQQRDKLLEALHGALGLVEQAQRILANGLAGGPSAEQDHNTINLLLGLLDGPEQREIQASANAAIAKVTGKPT